MRLFLFVLLVVPLTTLAQQAPLDRVDKLRKLYTESCMLADKSFAYSEKEQVLELSGFEIGVNPNTLVKSEIDRGENQKFRVSFYCQNGTSIKVIDQPGEAKAFLAIPLKTKKACRDFVELFDKLK